MALLDNPVSSWSGGIDLPSKLMGRFGDDYELYEEDDAFVLSVEIPGYDREDVQLTWHDGRLNVAAERVDEERGRKRTFHRAFRFPKDVEPDEIEASYENGVLEVRLPTAAETVRGEEIEIQ